jgi:hypothetical protein
VEYLVNCGLWLLHVRNIEGSIVVPKYQNSNDVYVCALKDVFQFPLHTNRDET